MQGAVIAPGGIDACVSAANCSVNMDPLHPPNVNCMLLAQLTHKASSLCCVGQSSYGPCASPGLCKCCGSAANRFACTSLQRKELDFHCLELDLISMRGFVYIFMLLC